MSEETLTKETMPISDKELLSNKLSEDINDKRIALRNLETQITGLERQKKAESNVDEAKHQEAKNKILVELSDVKDSIIKERDEWRRKNERLSEQRQMMEKNEKAIGDVKTQMDRLQVEGWKYIHFVKKPMS